MTPSSGIEEAKHERIKKLFYNVSRGLQQVKTKFRIVGVLGKKQQRWDLLEKDNLEFIEKYYNSGGFIEFHIDLFSCKLMLLTKFTSSLLIEDC